MSLRPLTPDQLQIRIRQWANDISGSMPVTIPVHRIGPTERSFYNARDFSQQHGSTVVFGWVVNPEDSLLRANFYAAVRFQGKVFSVTEEDANELTFFEDKRNKPRIVTSQGVEILHTFHPMVFPELKPSKRIVAVDPEVSAEIRMLLPVESRKPTPPPREQVKVESSVTHPSLRSMKRYTR